jgi:hypothetical protein
MAQNYRCSLEQCDLLFVLFGMPGGAGNQV